MRNRGTLRAYRVADAESGLRFMSAAVKEILRAVVRRARRAGRARESLSDPERDALRHFVADRCASPAFVQRLVREHGAASLLETFHLRDLPPARALAFLLRCHKGRFYRNRYPSLSLVQGGES